MHNSMLKLDYLFFETPCIYMSTNNIALSESGVKRLSTIVDIGRNRTVKKLKGCILDRLFVAF